MIRISADGFGSAPHVSRAAKVNLPHVHGQGLTGGEVGESVPHRRHGQALDQPAIPFSEYT